MLRKSRKSAVTIAILVLLATATTLFLAIHVLTSGALIDDLPRMREGGIRFFFVVLLVAILGGAFVAGSIYRLDDSHFGYPGLIRWLIFGILLGLLNLPSLIFSPVTGLRLMLLPSALELPFYLLFHFMFPPLSLYMSYWLVFKRKTMAG
jgi:hypothetical protein